MGTAFSRRGFLGMGLAAGVITLTACGSDSDKGSSAGNATAANLVMTVWGGESDKTAYQKRIDLLVKKFPELKVTLQLIPNDGYAQKVQTMIAGGKGPDIMQVAESVNVYSSKNQIQPLDDLASKAGMDLDKRFGAIGKLYSYQDKVYAIPDRSGAMIVFYNKALFAAKGIKAPTADWTWDDALSAFKELSVPGKQWGYAGGGWWAQWWSFVYQNGGRIIDDSGKPAVATDEVIDALQWTGDLIFKHGVVPTQKQYADMGADVGGDAGVRERQGRGQHHRLLGHQRPDQDQDRLGHRAAVAGQGAGGDRVRQRPGHLPDGEEPAGGVQGDRLPHRRRRRSSRSSPPARTFRPAWRCRRATRS